MRDGGAVVGKSLNANEKSNNQMHNNQNNLSSSYNANNDPGRLQAIQNAANKSDGGA